MSNPPVDPGFEGFGFSEAVVSVGRGHADRFRGREQAVPGVASRVRVGRKRPAR